MEKNAIAGKIAFQHVKAGLPAEPQATTDQPLPVFSY